MSTTADALSPLSRGRRPGYNLASAARAELIKLTSLRSTVLTVTFLVISSGVVTILSTQSAGHQPPGGYQGFDPTNRSLSGLLMATLAIGAFGALAATAEFATGTVRSSLAAVPRRGLFVAAKALVVGGVALVVGEAAAFVCYGLGFFVLSHNGVPAASLSHPGVARAVALSGAFLALLGLLALGLGIIVRHTAGAISAYAGFTFLLPLLMSSFAGHASRLTPIPLLANSVAAVVPQAQALSAPAAFGLMALYVAACLVLAAAVFLRRDA